MLAIVKRVYSLSTSSRVSPKKRIYQLSARKVAIKASRAMKQTGKVIETGALSFDVLLHLKLQDQAGLLELG